MKKILKDVFLFATVGLFFSACSVVEEVVVQNETVAETYETFTIDSVSFNMVFVKGGTFTMGATEEQSSEARENEKPSHQVTLSDFYIGETEVTQEIYQIITGKNYSTFKGKKYPATNLRYKDVQAFIEKLNQKTGKNSVFQQRQSGSMQQEEEIKVKVINIAEVMTCMKLHGAKG